MNEFFQFTATGRLNEIDEVHIHPQTGFKKRTFTITAGKGKSMHLALHYRDIKQLDGLKKEDLVIVEFIIKSKTLRDGKKINNLIAQKITRIY